MTVTVAYSPLTYNCNGSTTAFSVTWPFFLSSDLVVTHVTSAGVETTLVLNTDYTVTGGRDATTGLPAVGTVTTGTAYASGVNLRITRATPRTQSTSFTTSGAFPAKTVEAALDRAHMIAEEGGIGGGGVPDIDGSVLRLETSGATDYWDGDGYIARGFAGGVDDNDLVTKSQLDVVVDEVASSASAVAASASSAATSAATATTAAGTASTNATSAAGSATAAAASATSASGSASAAAASAAAAEAAANGEIGANTILGNNTGATAAASPLSVSQAKALLGIENVSNTSDTNKPVSTAQQIALDAKASLNAEANFSRTLVAAAGVGGVILEPGTATESGFVSFWAANWSALYGYIGLCSASDWINYKAEGSCLGHKFRGSVTFSNSVTFIENTITYGLHRAQGGAGTVAAHAGTTHKMEVYVPWDAGGTPAAVMAFHRGGVFAAMFGVDTDNKWKVGGWSMGANAYEIVHQGNLSTYVPSAIESSELTITASSSVTWAHGLGVRPRQFGAKLRCLTAEHGYAVGDEINADPYTRSDGWATCWANATNVSYGMAFSTYYASKTDGTTSVALTLANWRVILWAVK